MRLSTEKSLSIVLVILALNVLVRAENSFKLECNNEPEKSCSLTSKEVIFI